MAAVPDPPRAKRELAPVWVQTARAARLIGGVVAVLVSVPIILGTFIPRPMDWLPDAWSLMPPNAATSTLLLGLAVLIVGRSRLLTLLCTLIPAFLAAGALIGHVTGGPTWVETWLGDAAPQPDTALITVQSALWILLAATVITAHVLFPRWRTPISLATALLIMGALILTAGHAFYTLQVIDRNASVVSNWPTVIAVIGITFSWVGYWCLNGQWQGALQRGIAAITLRSVVVGALLLPFAVALLLQVFVAVGLLPPDVALAFLVALLSGATIVMGALLFRILRRLEGQLRRRALLDETTELWNEGAYWRLGHRAMASAQRRGEPVSVAMIDLDGLKRVNDTEGHEAGTELIATFAHAMRDSIRAADVAARMGGDEFALLGAVSAQQMQRIVSRMRERATELSAQASGRWTIRFSAGIAERRSTDESLRAVTRRADSAMYEEKRRHHAGR